MDGRFVGLRQQSRTNDVSVADLTRGICVSAMAMDTKTPLADYADRAGEPPADGSVEDSWSALQLKLVHGRREGVRQALP